MARKVRFYKTKQEIEDVLNTYLISNSDRVIKHLLEKTNCHSVEELHDDEFDMRWGLDCGFLTVEPSNPQMEHEWELDNGKYDTGMRLHYPYSTQSITLKDIQARFMLEDLNLTSEYYIKTVLD